jgi:hypothetical protein
MANTTRQRMPWQRFFVVRIWIDAHHYLCRVLCAATRQCKETHAARTAMEPGYGPGWQFTVCEASAVRQPDMCV